MSGESAAKLAGLLRQHRVLDMPALRLALPDRSQRSIMRDLAAVGYLASCNLSGRFYTLAELPEFDADGLWRHGQALFSREGTLKATVRRLVEKAQSGRTHPELQERLRLRVHNTLFELVGQGLIARADLDKLYLYVSADLQAREAQIARRREQLGVQPLPAPLDAEGVIAVLVAVIQRAARRPEDVVVHLRSEGRAVTVEQVAQVFERYGLAKKNAFRFRP